jgi:hypothetical protein
MAVFFDTAGWHQVDGQTWQDPNTGDALLLTYHGMVPNLPPFPHDPARMLRQLAIDTSASGWLIEANVVRLDPVPAIYQLVKVPIPNRDHGMVYLASLTIPWAHGSFVLCRQAMEGNYTGTREAMVATEVGPHRIQRPHPYAGDVPNLSFHEADDARWDVRFPDHPLTRVRAWAYQTMRTVRLDPRFAHLPPFPAAPGSVLPQPPAPPRPTSQLGGGPVTVLPGVPFGDLISLNHDDGGSSFWRMTDPNVAMARLGLGELDRSGAREVGVLDPTARTLRLGDSTAENSVTGLTPVDADEVLTRFDGDGIRRAFGVIADRAIRAAPRGEALVVSLDGWQVPPVPYFRLMLRLLGDNWHVHLHTTPIPIASPAWSGHQLAGDGQVFSGPGIDDTLPEAINLALRASDTWGAHPLRLAMSFVPHPDVQG